MSTEIDWVWHEPLSPNQIMDNAIEKYELDSLYVLLSGGKDSVCVADFIAKNYPKQFKGVVFTNTGLGSQETRKFVISYCKEKGWPLEMTWSTKEHDRFIIVIQKYGFAGPGNHGMWMGYLKYHAWYYFMKSKLEKGEKASYISGVRKKESMQREKIKKYTKEPVDLDGKQIFIKPFLYKNGSQLWDYFNENEMKKSPVYEWLNKSGECYCGAHAMEFELKLLEIYDPLAFQTIRYYEKIIKDTREYMIFVMGATESDVANWSRMYLVKHLKDKLEEWQKQIARLSMFDTWGSGPATEDIENQTLLDQWSQESGMTVNEDYCGESCQV